MELMAKKYTLKEKIASKLYVGLIAIVTAIVQLSVTPVNFALIVEKSIVKNHIVLNLADAVTVVGITNLRRHTVPSSADSLTVENTIATYHQ